MSLFKKPKRNFRVRESGDVDDADEEKTSEIITAVKSANKKEKDKKSKKEKQPSSQPLLSFDLDLNEGDDGEIFQVKKSSQSKKMRKLLDKERKKKKEPSRDDKDITNANGSEKKSIITTDDDIVITVKNTLPNMVLNGREAEAADVEGMSSDEEVAGHHKFSKASSDVKMLLQRGRIPDAATIHAVKKQRQHVREMSDFIPINDENSREKEKGGRLAEDEDDEGSDGEKERIQMTVDTASEDRMRLRAEFTAAQQDKESGESDKGEEDEWEQQQIRKGVTGAQIAAVQQESMYYQQYMMGCPPPPVISMEAPAPPTIGNAFLQPSRASDPPTANSVVSRLKNRLSELREVERSHKSELDRGRIEMRVLVEEAEKVREGIPSVEEKFRFYQELRGYVTDLVECLDEKILVIEMLEDRVLSTFARRVQEGIGRRRQDVQDQAYELPSNVLKVAASRDEATIRRIAEREGRRIRRQRQREIKGTNVTHVDGMSSDDEQTEVQLIANNNSIEVIEKDSKLVFEDVYEDFSTVEGILSRFQVWRERDMHSYSEAYMSLCLPKVLGPIIRLNIIFWNPLQPGFTEIEKNKWFKTAILYGMKVGETEEDLKKDPDAQLIPRIIDKIILPRLNRLVQEGWDPLSNSQTICLVSLVTRFIQEYPTLTHNSKSVRLLMESVVSKIRAALNSDVFIPLYTKVRLAESKVNSFFMRQCATAIKLLGNIARWQGLLNDDILCDLAIDSLLNRYLIMAIGSTNPLQAANIIHMIGSVLPRIWITSKLPKLNVFLNQIRTISLQLSCDKPSERDAREKMSSIL